MQAAKANVGISVEFPTTGASAARIDDNATAVLVQVWDITAQKCNEGNYCNYVGDPTKSVRLERPVGGGTVSASLLGVSPGEAMVRVTQLNVDGEKESTLETVNVSANLVKGQNNMTVTLIRAAWTLQTPVTFNKIVTTDTTRIDSFSVVPFAYFYDSLQKAAASPEQYMHGISSYATILRGSNLCSYDEYGGYGGNITCGQSELASGYNQVGGLLFNRHDRHDSIDTSKNISLLTPINEMPLADDSQERERGWAAYSLGQDGSRETASDPDFWKEFNIAVTGGSTIQGNFVEWLTKSMSEGTRKCYSDDQLTTEITCPSQAVAAKASVKHGKPFLNALGKAIAKSKASPGKAAADVQGCFRDLEMTYKEFEHGGYIQENGSYISWYYGWDVTEIIDACRHPFTATASQLSQTDVDLIQVR